MGSRLPQASPNHTQFVRKFHRNINNLEIRIDPSKFDPIAFVGPDEELVTDSKETGINTTIWSDNGGKELKEIKINEKEDEHYAEIDNAKPIFSLTYENHSFVNDDKKYETADRKSKISQEVQFADVKALELENKTDLENSRRKSGKIKRKWFVLLAGCIMIFFSTGIPFQLSILYVELLEEFGASNAETSLVQAVCNGMFFAGGISSGLFVARFGTRIAGTVGAIFMSVGLSVSYFAMNIPYLIVTIGLIAGYGFSLGCNTAYTSAGQHFTGKGKLLALSSVSFASGIGSMSIPYIIEFLINQFGWRGTLLMLAGLTLNLIPASLLCKPVIDIAERIKRCERKDFSRNNGQSEDNINDETKENQKSEILEGLKNLLKDKVFVLYVLGMTLALSALNCFLIFYIDFLQSKGLDRSSAVFVIFICNAVSAVGRFVPGLLKKLPHVSVLSFPTVSSAIGCVAMSLFPMAMTYEQLILVSCFYGIALGGVVNTLSIGTVRVVGIANYSTGLGILFSVCSLGGISAGPIAGKLRDISGSYDLMFYCSSGSLGFAFIIFIITTILKRKYRIDKDSLEMEIYVNRRQSRKRSSILPWKRSLDFVY